MASRAKLNSSRDELKHELMALKKELESGDWLGAPPRSAPSDPSVSLDEGTYHKQRKAELASLLKVPAVKDLTVQADDLREEMELAAVREHTAETLPQVLLAHFSRRKEELRWAAYLLRLRWARFCNSATTITTVGQHYTECLEQIDLERLDATNRAHRLRQMLEAGGTGGYIDPADCEIFARTMCCELRSARAPQMLCAQLRSHVVQNELQLYRKMSGVAERRDSIAQKRWGKLAGNTRKKSSSIGSILDVLTGAAVLPSAQLDHLPIIATNYRALKPRLHMVLDVYGLIVGNGTVLESDADELQLFYQAKNLFYDKFPRIRNSREFLPYQVKVDELTSNDPAEDVLYLKEADWLAARSIYARRDPQQQRRTAILNRYAEDGTDEVLKAESEFLVQGDIDYAFLNLKQRSMSMRKTPSERTTSVASHRRADQSSTQVWKGMYRGHGVDMADAADADPDAASGIQGESKDQAGRDCLTSYLYLRFLHTCELQLRCRGVLNYFRSLERTLALDFCSTNVPNQPHNRDDYHANDRGFMHILDASGKMVIYDSTITDYEILSRELLALGSYYITRNSGKGERDPSVLTNSRRGDDDDNESIASGFSNVSGKSNLSRVSGLTGTSRFTGGSGRSGRKNAPSDANFDEMAYRQASVDRAGVLLDLWTYETEFQRAKADLAALYFNAYLHTFNENDRRRLAQIIIDIGYRRPRYDLEAPYFVNAIVEEIACLRKHVHLVNQVMRTVIDDERRFRDDIKVESNTRPFGLPQALARIQPILLHNPSSVSSKLDIDPTKVHLCEHHPALAVVADIYAALSYVSVDAERRFEPSTSTELIRLNQGVIECAETIWSTIESVTPDSLNLSETVSQLWNSTVLDNPTVLVSAAKHAASMALQASGVTETVDVQCPKVVLDTFGVLLDTMCMRQRLLVALYDTISLNLAYTSRCISLGLDPGHAYLRAVSFNRASSAQQQDPQFDPYEPVKVTWAALEIADESSAAVAIKLTTASELAFGLQASIAEKPENAKFTPGMLGQLQCLLQVQLAARNLVIAAVEHREVRERPETAAEDHRRIKELLVNIDPRETPLKVVQQNTSFASIQRIKYAARMSMFANELGSSGTGDSAIRVGSLLWAYCQNLTNGTASVSMRTQMARYTRNLKRLLDGFPSTRDYYFQLGSAEQADRHARLKKAAHLATTEDEPKVGGGILKNKIGADAKAFEKAKRQQKPLQLLKDDGSRLLNPWYLPHEAEVCVMYSSLKPEDELAALRVTVGLLFCISELVNVLCAHARVGSSHARLGTMDVAFVGVGADWGGAEGIGAELRQLRRNLTKLKDPGSPSAVYSYLEQRRKNVFMEWLLTCRYYARETFLGKSNQTSFDTLLANSRSGLSILLAGDTSSHIGVSAVGSVMLGVHTPWRKQLMQYGSFRGLCDQHDTGAYLEMCLTNLSDIERHAANGEVLGISLLLEDIEQEQGVKESDSPAETVMLSAKFLETSARLEQLKHAWCERALGIKIDTASRYQQFIDAYDDRIVKHVVAEYRSSLKGTTDDDSIEYVPQRRQRSTAGVLVGHGSATQLHGIPELTYRQRLVDELECQIELESIKVIRKMVRTKHSAVVAERALLGGKSMPTQMWLSKDVNSYSDGRQRLQPKTKVPPVPSDVANMTSDEVPLFVADLLAVASENADGNTLTIDKADLRACVARLGVSVADRTKSMYIAYAERARASEMQFGRLIGKKDEALREKQSALEKLKQSFEHRLRCKVADRSRDLIGEITALRAKLSRMRDEQDSQEKVVRERVKREYDDLVHSLFSTSFALKNRFEEYRGTLYEDVVDNLAEIRKEAIGRMKMVTVAKETGDLEKYDEMKRNADNLRDVQSENGMLSGLILKMRSMNDWKRTGLRSVYGKKITLMKEYGAAYKKALYEVKLVSKEKEVQSSAEISALRAELAHVQGEVDMLKTTLTEERTKRQQMQQWKAQKMKVIQNAEAKAALWERIKHLDMDKALHDLDTLDAQLASSKKNVTQQQRLRDLNEKKLRAENRQLRAQLAEELRIKTDAVSQLVAKEQEWEETSLERSMLSPEAVDGGVTSPDLSKPIDMNAVRQRPKSAVVPTTRTSVDSISPYATAVGVSPYGRSTSSPRRRVKSARAHSAEHLTDHPIDTLGKPSIKLLDATMEDLKQYRTKAKTRPATARPRSSRPRPSSSRPKSARPASAESWEVRIAGRRV